jgi:hypothetical protein
MVRGGGSTPPHYGTRDVNVKDCEPIADTWSDLQNTRDRLIGAGGCGGPSGPAYGDSTIQPCRQLTTIEKESCVASAKFGL